MRAEVKHIQSNDHPKREDFLQMEPQEPWNGSGWFSVEIGPDDGGDTGEMFQAFVITPAAMSHVKPFRGEFRCVIADSFDPDTITTALREHVAAISADSWAEVREQLRKTMWWEWENR